MSESSAASEQFSGHGSPAAATWVSHYNITWVDIVITAHLLSLCHITIPRLIELSMVLRKISQCLFRFFSVKALVCAFKEERALPEARQMCAKAFSDYCYCKVPVGSSR